jgi:hypothetical protein
MATLLLYAAAFLCVVTALIHSYFGEKRLIAPVINAGHGVMVHPLAKQVMRFAWHWTSALWVLIAAYLALSAQGTFVYPPLVIGIGLVHLVAGILDGVFTRGKHIGWPPITLIGVLVLVASL